MEGSSLAKAHAYIRQTQMDCLQAAGLPSKPAVAWTRLGPWRITGNFTRDVAAGTKIWRGGADLLVKLPKKLQRTAEQQLAADFILSACRSTRENFLKRHAETVYRKLTRESRQISRESMNLLTPPLRSCPA